MSFNHVFILQVLLANRILLLQLLLVLPEHLKVKVPHFLNPILIDFVWISHPIYHPVGSLEVVGVKVNCIAVLHDIHYGVTLY